VLAKDLVDLRAIAGQAVEGTQHQFQERRHVLALELPETEVLVEGDAVRLEQVVSNLLSNAAKYTRPGGRIVLQLASDREQAVLCVRDNGIGISSEMLHRIFDLFVQADTSLERSQGGLGIGLTLVRRLVGMQGGTIEVNSRGLEEGSEFIMRLPLVCAVRLPDQKVVLERQPEACVAAAAGGRRRILVVDDSLDSGNTTALLLRLEGHGVQAVYDGPEALEAAREFKPEIVL